MVPAETAEVSTWGNLWIISSIFNAVCAVASRLESAVSSKLIETSPLSVSAMKVFEKFKEDPRFKDLDNSNKATRTEFRVTVNDSSAKAYGVNGQAVGDELRGYVEGYTPTKLRQNGLEYNLRLRLQEKQRDIKENFNKIFVPNINNKLIRLADIASTNEGIEPATIP